MKHERGNTVGSEDDGCNNKDGVCHACMEAHKHSITLYELVNKKVDKKDQRLHKALEDHSTSIQTSLDEGKARFTKIEDKAESELKDVRKTLDRKCTEERTWVEKKLKELADSKTTNDIQKKADKRQVTGILVMIGMAALSALITAVITFTFLRGAVTHLEKDVDFLNKENIKCIIVHATIEK